jgi:hypothetical protein
MKALLFAILLAGAAGIMAADETPSLTGKWQVHTNINGNENDQVCTIEQKGSELTGNCSSDQGSGAIAGKVDAQKVTWTYKSTYNGNPLTAVYNGTIEMAKITGGLRVEEFGVEGQFTATPSKP